MENIYLIVFIIIILFVSNKCSDNFANKNPFAKTIVGKNVELAKQIAKNKENKKQNKTVGILPAIQPAKPTSTTDLANIVGGGSATVVSTIDTQKQATLDLANTVGSGSTTVVNTIDTQKQAATDIATKIVNNSSPSPPIQVVAAMPPVKTAPPLTMAPPPAIMKSGLPECSPSASPESRIFNAVWNDKNGKCDPGPDRNCRTAGGNIVNGVCELPAFACAASGGSLNMGKCTPPKSIYERFLYPY